MTVDEVERTWDLSDIFKDVLAWERELEEVRGQLARLDGFRPRSDGDDGKPECALGPERLADLLDICSELSRRLGRLHTYASLLADEDTRLGEPRGMLQRVDSLAARASEATAFVDPTVLDLSRETLAGFLDVEPRLAVYRRYFERLEARRAHTLTRAEEELLGASVLTRGDGHTISGLLLDSEIPWPTVRLSGGREVRLDPSGYTRSRNSTIREDRRLVFEGFHSCLGEFRRVLAASLHSTLKEHAFEARVRRYADGLESALRPNEVDPSVYHTLIEEVGRALPGLHRYLRLHGKILGIADLCYHDIYAPLVGNLETRHDWETARREVLEALAPLGEEYGQRLSHALHERWVDVDPRQGKRSGAYVNDGAYGVHPYMLLNHHDDYHSASTIAHEAGHLMHSWYSHERQPFPTARYVVFVAEVASTFNEALFFHYQLERATTREKRLALLGHYLEGIRGTVFRQTMFAEFELAIHRAVEADESLTGDSLSELYLALLRRYHGHDVGVMSVDERYGAEWGFVPHFHFGFYVYQYATSCVAATALSRAVLRGESGAVERYIDFLSAGSSKPPVQLLRDAGVDMTSPEPIRATMREMDEVMDQIEDLI